MLTPQDDLLGHQLPTTFNEVVTSDDRWTERYWYSGEPIAGGDMVLDMGLGYYPNKNVMDGFAGFTIDNKQHNFRVSRQLGRNPLETTLGPLTYEVVDGMKLHRCRLEENDSSLTFDLEFDARFPATREEQSFRRKQGRVIEDCARVVQFGRWEGWVKIDGQQFDLTPDDWWAQRDHSWGIRSQMQTDRQSNATLDDYQNFMWFWCTYQFEDFGLSLFLKERAPDRPMYFSGSEIGRDGKEKKIVKVDHDIDWADDPLGQSWKGGKMRLHYRDGSTRDITFETLPGRFYLKGGMYGGFGGWQQGDDKGPLFTAADIWDLGDVETRLNARTLGDHVTRVHCDGAVGYGMSEYGVATGYPKYLEPQKFPPI